MWGIIWFFVQSLAGTFMLLFLVLPFVDLDALQAKWWPPIENCQSLGSAEKPNSRQPCGANCVLVIVTETFQCPVRQIVLERPWKIDTSAE